MFKRPWEAVLLEGAALSPLFGHRVEALGLVAVGRDGRPRAVPFQVERKTSLLERGQIGARERLVFSACDVGLAGSGLTAMATIVVTDAGRKRRGFLYVVNHRTGDRPGGYVTYDEAADRVASAAYEMRFEDGLPADLYLGGRDVLQRFRVALRGTLIGGLGTWSIDEEDVDSALTGFVAGPVRVTRRMRHRVPLLLGIQSPGSSARTHFTALGITVPGKFKLPLPAGLVFRSLGGYAGAVLRPVAGHGWQVVTPRATVWPPRSDGRQEEPWFVLRASGTGILFALELDAALRARLRLLLDRSLSGDGPPTIGFSMGGAERIPRGRYRFALRVVFLPDYRAGEERRVLGALARPLHARAVTPSGF